MSIQPRTQIIICVIALIVVVMACTLPTATPRDITPTATTGSKLLATLPSTGGTAPPAVGASAGGSSSGSSSGQGSTGGGKSSGSNPLLPPSNETLPEATPTPTIPLPNAGPYVVKQVESLGGETISGIVCSSAHPFTVNAATSKVAWVFVFLPENAGHGNVTYVYSIPSAGEAHNATGSYTISPPDKDGTLHLSLKVSDHVTFKGFDGNIPLSYKFDLVPSGNSSCPPTP